MSAVTLTLETGEKIELAMKKGSLGYQNVDIKPFSKHKLFAYDPGLVSTAVCESSITYVDGDKGILLYRGYPINQLAKKF